MPEHQSEILYEGVDGSAWAFTCGYCEQNFSRKTLGRLAISDLLRHECSARGAIVVVYPPIEPEDDELIDEFDVLRAVVSDMVDAVFCPPFNNAPNREPEDG